MRRYQAHQCGAGLLGQDFHLDGLHPVITHHDISSAIALYGRIWLVSIKREIRTFDSSNPLRHESSLSFRWHGIHFLGKMAIGAATVSVLSIDFLSRRP